MLKHSPQEIDAIWEDPIVAEVGKTREQLAGAFNFDVKAIFADLRKRQAESGVQLVRRKDQPKQVLPEEGAGTPIS
jgi:hypothetical protein